MLHNFVNNGSNLDKTWCLSVALNILQKCTISYKILFLG